MVAADGDSPEKNQGKSYQNAQVTGSSIIHICLSTLLDASILVLL
jgi:hypothetical protein